ncbi:uncharacterized protein FFB20_04999 [Fusarium fujikuroi]|nr:uncharacterized protein FFB20_04999 [Fusarium fujikuroi]SCO01351.1 uncharacterized protein FFC1_08882 [Fusarium fujikuroi]SCO06006.1 uncharacterized protein FFE2_10914 [Fusarium fujikuroi]SCO10160.1 uncharacterized protein FFM5_09743 [Fusarium fujikuroi]SCO47154.1 uncharacterized protein FFNC_11220 [Fusarium fujikuroi]
MQFDRNENEGAYGWMKGNVIVRMSAFERRSAVE